jgi:iron complex outermembrane recepter protein
MKNITLHLTNTISVVFILLLIPHFGFSQIKISRQIKDKDAKNPMIGVSILIKDTQIGTLTDVDGKYELNVPSLPSTLVVTYVGYEKQELTIHSETMDILMEEENTMISDVVVSASRIEERILESPVTIEKLDPIAIKQAASPDYYDDLANLKGVQTQKGSLTFTSINTRGFASAANNRFVQLIDGMDNAAPLLQFPLGNLVGVSELDIQSVELLPGAASALYGPNAYNGILLMTSKNPFTSQGLSVQTKAGFNTSKASGTTDPLYQVTARYAKSFGRFAFKTNIAYLDATDWRANDYTTGRKSAVLFEPSTLGAPNFDGLNMYGDETPILIPMTTLAGSLSKALAPAFAASLGKTIPETEGILSKTIPKLPTLDIRRTGLKEENLLDNSQAKSVKFDAALHYKITDKLTASYGYRFGNGASVYQGAERYALRGFISQYHKLELTSPSFWLRAYQNRTKDGDSYNLSALGAFVNERFKSTSAAWVPTYAGTYAGALLPLYLQGKTAEAAQIAGANTAARTAADKGIPAVGTSEFKTVVDAVRKDLFQRNPPGAGFVDESVMSHVETGFNFKNVIDANLLDLLVGANYRLFDLYSEGTVLNEDPDKTGTFKRIKVDEYGAFAQVSKQFFNEKLKLSGSLRYDKAQNFEGQVSPRVSFVYTAGAQRQHNIRGSFQTGFRNPSNQDQYIFFPSGGGILLGGTKANAERYGVYNGGSYTENSYQKFITSVLAGAPNPALLQSIIIEYVRPEKLKAFEIGYKGIIGKKLFLDVNVYHNIYKDFIKGQTVRTKKGTTIGGVFRAGVEDLIAGKATAATPFRAVSNATEDVQSTGFGLGINYRLNKGFSLYGNYTYADYNLNTNDPDFTAGFNTPKHAGVIGLNNRKLFKNMGFDINYRQQSAFDWENAFGFSKVKAYGVLNCQVNYELPKINTNIKIGATNLGGKDYRTMAGGPFIGQQYYIALTYEGVKTN